MNALFQSNPATSGTVYKASGVMVYDLWYMPPSFFQVRSSAWTKRGGGGGGGGSAVLSKQHHWWWQMVEGMKGRWKNHFQHVYRCHVCFWVRAVPLGLMKNTKKICTYTKCKFDMLLHVQSVGRTLTV